MMRRGVILAALGLVGVTTLAAMPFERLVPSSLDPVMLRALALVQPAILTLLLVAVGSWAAPRVGLGAPLIDAIRSRGDVRAVLRRQLPAAILVGVAVALLLIGYGLSVGQRLSAGMAGSPLAGFSMPLVTKLFYGGVTEELLTRWGLMSLFAWFAWRAGGRPATTGGATMIAAILLAALLFAAGHLPLLALIAPDASTSIVAAVIAANALPGVLFGWLYWRRGIEAAMIAHALAHLLSHPVV